MLAYDEKRLALERVEAWEWAHDVSGLLFLWLATTRALIESYFSRHNWETLSGNVQPQPSLP